MRTALLIGAARGAARRAGYLLLLVVLFSTILSLHEPVRAAATLSQQIDPPEAGVGDQVTVTYTIQNGSGVSVNLPPVAGLENAGSSNSSQFTFTNGVIGSSVAQSFTLIPQRVGDFIIPGFTIQLGNGQVLRAQPMKLHVGEGATPGPAPVVQAPPPGTGPVVMPPAGADQNPAPSSNLPASPPGDNGTATLQPPTDSDGRPTKVFMVITPKTTEAYVGETIPVRIEFYIRADSNSQQDSLPTIKGSDFLMNDLGRPAVDQVPILSDLYQRETWVTAISAPRSGNFPLEMVRDSYWLNGGRNIFSDPLSNFFSARGKLMHGMVSSNKLVVNARPLPEAGRPADFRGAIGQFKVSGTVSPTAVNVGDPAYLDFTISGEGNFNTVRSPVLAVDPAWKTYPSAAQLHYVDEFRTTGDKLFHQAIIPRHNGVLAPPAASFSFFDPVAKKYVTQPISLGTVTVSGTAMPDTPSAAPAASAGAMAAPTAPGTPQFAANLPGPGRVASDLAPAYRRPWFWFPQAALLVFIVLAGLVALAMTRQSRNNPQAEAALRRRSLQELEMAMRDCVARDDAPRFFAAARRAVQLRLGAELGLPADMILPEGLRANHPEAAEAIAPLFNQADEVMYSGHARDGIDLAEWERRVHEEIFHAPVA